MRSVFVCLGLVANTLPIILRLVSYTTQLICWEDILVSSRISATARRLTGSVLDWQRDRAGRWQASIMC